MLGRDVLVLHLAGFGLGRVEHFQRALREVTTLAAVHLGNLTELVLQPLLHELGLGADALEQGRDQPLLLLEQGSQKVLGQDFLVVALAGDRLGLLQGLLRLDRKLVEFHGPQSNAGSRAGKGRAGSRLPWISSHLTGVSDLALCSPGAWRPGEGQTAHT